MDALGLALCLLPTVLNIAELAKATHDAYAVRSLPMRIATSEKIFKESIWKLLQGDEKLSDSDRVGLVNGDADFVQLWKDHEFVMRLRRRLDTEVLRTFQSKAREISTTLTTLKEQIEQVESYSEKKPGAVRPREAKLGLQVLDIKKSLAKLKNQVNDVRKLLEPCSATTYAPSGDSQQNRDYARSGFGEKRHQKTDAQFFDAFYSVLRESFRCTCAIPHEASLRLSENLEILFPVETGDSEEEDMISDLFRTTWSRSRSAQNVSHSCGEHQALPLRFSESRGSWNAAPIVDLCHFTRAIKNSAPNSPASGNSSVLKAKEGRYTVTVPVRYPLSMPTVVSMDDVLDSCDSYGISRRTRLDMTLDLVLAIVQFYQTPWIDASWTWRNFAMIRNDSEVSLGVTRRFWSVSSEQGKGMTANALPSKFWGILRTKDPMLVRLGFALIELAMGKRLSEIRLATVTRTEGAGETDQDEAVRDMEDYNTAMDLLDRNVVRDEVGVTYQQAVAACLQCKILEDEGMRPLKPGTDTFEEDLGRFIIDPLRQHAEDLYGMPL
ncbi:hypothetical protein NKR23_g6571 [Pleurostoma richardsiae]|uniref:DUF7580 domain-containing protein n=1 Tax=Pleurostoma richardsiae TaxID=41990 RepID=A0AA38RPC6_9PEZI|nr:hypothetical protein NKR23_g6571 [Pleurostoma richardsiae]